MAWVMMVVAGLSGCGNSTRVPRVALPVLQLAPAALGCEISLQQRLRVVAVGQARELEALLEVDPGEVRLMVQGLGQVGVRLHWDGRELRQQRAGWLPPVVRAERVLDDLQFALWPASEIRKVLSDGWSLDVQGTTRALRKHGETWLLVRGARQAHMELENLAEDYRLDIDTAGGGLPACMDEVH